MRYHHKRNRRRGLAGLLTAMLLLPMLGTPIQFALAEGSTPSGASSGKLKRDGIELTNDSIVLATDTLTWEQPVTFTNDTTAIELPVGLIALNSSKATLSSETRTYTIDMDIQGQNITVHKPQDSMRIPGSQITNTLPPVQPETMIPEKSESAEKEQTAPPQQESELEEPAAPPQTDPQQPESPAPVEPDPGTEPEPQQPAAPEMPTIGIDPEALISAAVFSLVPHAAAAGEEYTLSVPCKVDMSKVKDGKIAIGDPKILDLSVSQTPGKEPAMDLYTKYENEEDNTPLQGEINLNTPLYLRLFWEDLEWITTGTQYSIRLPSPLSSAAAAQNGKITLSGALDPNGKPMSSPDIATWSIDQGSNILHITFLEETFYLKDEDGNLQELHTKDASNVYFTFQSMLDEGQLNQGSNAETTFTLPGGKEYKITINDWKPKAPELKKSAGTFNADGVITWTVKYTTASSTFDKAGVPAKLVDTLPEGLEYVPSSLSGPTDPVDGITIDASDPKKPVFILSDKLTANTEYTFTYQTQLSNEILLEQWASQAPVSKTFTNTIQGKTSNDADISGLKASSTATIDEKWSGWQLVAKVGELEWDGERPFVKWTITVNTVSRQFVSLTVVDTLGKGLTLNGDITIEDDKHTPSKATYTIAKDTNSGKAIVNIPLITKDPSGSSQTASSRYVLTYRTDVDPSYFSQTGSDIPQDDDLSNAATLEWEWPTGKGPGPDYIIPTIEKKPGDVTDFSKKMVKKSAGNYDPTERALRWTVTVNPNKVDLKEIILKETLDQTPNQHTFDRTERGSSTAIMIADAVQKIETAIQTKLPTGATASVSYDAGVTSNCTELIIKVTGLGKNLCTFSFDSYASDPKMWANNIEDAKFQNTASVTSATMTDGLTVNTADMTVTATETVNLDVLKKEVSSYDAAKQEIVWRLKVNTSKVPLSKATITETLPQGLSYVDGSAKIGAPNTEESAMSALNGVEQKDGAIIFTLPDQTAPTAQWLLFRTKVDVNTEEYKEETEITYSNQISMKNAEGSDPAATCDFTLINNPLTKTSVNDGNRIEYTVSLNPLGVDLSENLDGAVLYMKDQLGDCLFLDVDSVKIAAAKQVTYWDGRAYKVKLEPIGDGTPVADVDYHTAENFFQIAIPDATKPYVITYTAYATRGGELTNQVSLIGSKLPENGALESQTHSFNLSASAGARLRLPAGKFLSFSVKKVKGDGNLLKDAATEFGVYSDAATQNLITKGYVNAQSGYCELGLPVSSIAGIDTLYLKELTAPNGYEKSPAAIKISVKDIQAATGPDGYVETVKNVKAGEETSGSLTILKKDNYGTPLEGVTFGLYSDPDAEVPVIKDGSPVTGTTNANGKIVFNGLYPGSTYYVKEQSTPETHVLDATPHQVQASAENIITNAKAEAAIKITKVRDGKEDVKLQGAKFQLFTDAAGTNQKGAEQETGADGVAEFKGLQPNTTYYLKETVAPTGYEGNDKLLGKLVEVKTEANKTTVELTVTNKKILVSIKVTKVRQGKEEIKLPGAVFELYQSDQTTKAGSAQTTNENGEATFKSLEPQTTYWLKETVTPKGYKTPQNVWTEVKTAEFTKLENAVTVKNEKILVPLHVIKQGDGADHPRLPGVKLALYAEDKTTLVHEAQTTDANGETTFTDLEPETTYYIRETEAPTGYRVKNEWTQAKTGAFDAAKPADVTVVNEKILVGIRVIKVRQGSPETKLQGAEFELYSDAEGKNLLRAAQATDANGVTEFTGLQPETTYYLKETQAPSGYRTLSDELIAVKTGEGVEGAQPVEQTVENARRHSSGGGSGTNKPKDPPDPVVPVGPTDPNDPDQPTDPADPDDPAKPTDPTDPDAPADPSDPAHPGGSADPGQPGQPGGVGQGTATVPSGSTGGGASGRVPSVGNRVSSIPETGVKDRIPLWAFGLACSLGLAAVLCLSQLLVRPKGKHVKKRG